MCAYSTYYINIHGHHPPGRPDEWVLRNLEPASFGSGEQIDFPCSLGLHPYRIENCDPETTLNAIRRAAPHPSVLAIGEAGLDRSLTTDIHWQEELLLRQLRIAEDYGLPLILHVVRAYSDMLQLVKERKPKVPMILHGYSGSLQMTRELIRAGFYFSFGEALLKGHGKAIEALRIVPETRLFFERDERHFDLVELYHFAAAQRGIPLASLRSQVCENTSACFKRFDKED
ncbi:MAG: hypothetical protein CSA96_09175 [Bacteroidetes bacterium]|nr:MAG: hypothetical protein CSA96_09175 [Bacteroidota bacterium]